MIDQLLPVIGRLEHDVRPHVQHVRVERRIHDRIGPLEPVLRVGRVVTHRIQGPRVETVAQPRAAVQHLQHAAVVAAVDDVRIEGIRRDVSALAPRHAVELRVRRGRWPAASAPFAAAPAPAAEGAHRSAGWTGVLLGAADIVRDVVREMHVVELSRRRGDAHARGAAVGRDHRAIVVHHHQPLGVVARPPDVVVVARRRTRGTTSDRRPSTTRGPPAVPRRRSCPWDRRRCSSSTTPAGAGRASRSGTSTSHPRRRTDTRRRPARSR